MAFPLPYPLGFYLLLMLPIATCVQAYSNISLGSSLKAANGSPSWTSPSGDFAFGFQEIQNDGFLLAIWFNKIPERTIVWSANRNNLVQGGSTAQLTRGGQLVLYDPSGQRIWAADLTDVGVWYAAMLDTGNFVLANKDGGILWESFDHPTDTILPTQTLNQEDVLLSRVTQSNYSHGRFMFILQGDGNLVLYTTHYPLNTNNAAYWSTQDSIGSGYQLIFNQSGYIFLVAKNGSILNWVTSNAASTDDFYLRAIVDYDGVFRQYVYPKTASSRGAWPLSWTTLSFIPSNICLRVGGAAGSGACGFNSYCSFSNNQTSCLCPPGYDFLDPEDKRKGCKQNFIPQNCNDTSHDSPDLFELITIPNTDWPQDGSDYEVFDSQTEDWCRQACLSDCYCAVAVFRDNKCWKKRLPLSNGRFDSGVNGKDLIKVRKGNSISSDSKRKGHSTLFLIVLVLLGGSMLLNIFLLVATRFNLWKQKKVDPYQPVPAIDLRSFTFNEMEAATGGFKEEIGRGAFGTVYKGMLPHDNRVVAIKKLDRMERQGENEFKTEVMVIGGTNHRNLVNLLGFCDDAQHRLLLFEYMSNGSLANFIFGDYKLRWYSRIQIAFGIARGLFYLHEECSSQIIHCDVKPQNILLDESLSAKISDFGLAKFMKVDQTRTTTMIRGTKGYVAPEWFKNLAITVKVDVYSFGIVLLELISCRRNFEPDMEEDRMILADWAYDCYTEGKLHLLVENDEEAMDDMKSVEKFVMIAIWCIQEDPSLRPAMKKVTQMLEGAVKVPTPPDPTSFMSIV